MNAKVYLKSYGWVEGEALQNGGLKKPILVKHKKDLKGLGHDSNDSDNWWEKLFDGQLKNLEVNQGPNKEVSIKTNEDLVERDLRKLTSPLYKMFVKGKGLEGTVGKIYLNSLKEDGHNTDAKKDNSKVGPVPSLNFNKEKSQSSKLKTKKKKEKKAKKEKEKGKNEKLKKKSKEKESSKSKKVKSDTKRHKKADKDDSASVTKKRKRSSQSEKSSKKSKT